MNDDLERMISDSLGERAAGVSSATAGIDAVYDRVAHRRARRRGVAAVGSVALIAVGVFAVAAVGDDDSFTPAAPPDSASLDGALGGWAEVVPAGTPVWRCSGNVVYSDADGNSYWADCESTTLTEDVGVFPNVVPTTISWTGDCWATTSVPGEVYATSAPCEFAPATTAPWPTTTYVVCEQPVDSIPVTVPCGTQPVTATNPPMVTTTTIWCQEGVDPNGVAITAPGCESIGTITRDSTAPELATTTTSNP